MYILYMYRYVCFINYYDYIRLYVYIYIHNPFLNQPEPKTPWQASTSAFAALRADGVIIAWGAPDCGGHFHALQQNSDLEGRWRR